MTKLLWRLAIALALSHFVSAPASAAKVGEMCAGIAGIQCDKGCTRRAAKIAKKSDGECPKPYR
ncbi:hypothetical protein EHO51_10895 [Methylocystis rosea]|uniref:Uncharacterized protein n=2 Tax=Methylocystis rosea TaxID=173366 RepID=A0A3G8M9A9_9HYPH|nr:hypothetical protein EHO51_10895 [Methylocystis rosea]